MTDAPKLLTEAEADRLFYKSHTEALAELRERGLIAQEPDPLLIEAREMLVGLHERGLHLAAVASGTSGNGVLMLKNGAANKLIRAGEYDKHGRLLEVLAALRRGMELAKPELTREMVREAVRTSLGEGGAVQRHDFSGTAFNRYRIRAEAFIDRLHAALSDRQP